MWVTQTISTVRNSHKTQILSNFISKLWDTNNTKCKPTMEKRMRSFMEQVKNPNKIFCLEKYSPSHDGTHRVCSKRKLREREKKRNGISFGMFSLGTASTVTLIALSTCACLCHGFVWKTPFLSHSMTVGCPNLLCGLRKVLFVCILVLVCERNVHN